MHWREVKQMIEEELDRCYFDMPLEIKASRAGIYFSKAGVRHTTIGNLYYGIQDPMALGLLLVEGTLYTVLADDSFSLEASKKLFVYTTQHKVRLLGAKSDKDHPGCDAAWLNMPNLWKFYTAIEDCLDTVETKKDLKNLLWSWENYVNSLGFWHFLSFPWELGQLTIEDRITTVEEAREQLDFDREFDTYVRG